MVASIANAISAYANAGRMVAPPGASGEAPAGTSFGDLLKQAAGDTVDTLKQGEAASLQAVTGKADLAQVTAAVTNAEVVLQAVVAVRDRVVQAYQDISRLSI
jgi:flagellar hook-basal body complex protein FliE